MEQFRRVATYSLWKRMASSRNLSGGSGAIPFTTTTAFIKDWLF
jgi:hypothetical protein